MFVQSAVHRKDARMAPRNAETKHNAENIEVHIAEVNHTDYKHIPLNAILAHIYAVNEEIFFAKNLVVSG